MAVCQIMIQDYLSKGKIGRQIKDSRDLLEIDGHQYYTDNDLIEGIDYYEFVKEYGLNSDPLHNIKPDEFIKWAKKSLLKTER